jgi:Uma2 family endonuclease
MATVSEPVPNFGRLSSPGEPTWEIALLYPRQGEWTEAEYLALDARTNLLIELSDGCLEFLPMPSVYHQRVVEFLFMVLRAFVITRNLGEVKLAPLPVRLWAGKIREPDVLYFRSERQLAPHDYPSGVDLAIEVVSGSWADRKRDLEIKRDEYARAGIAEYWIVDPQEQTITVLTLDAGRYREHGAFRPSQKATSVLLAGFEVNVHDVFAAGNQPPKA